MANEYDLMTKSDDDWHRLGRLVAELDPYFHPRSIHQCVAFFDHSADWITHASIQKVDNYRTAENTDVWRAQWKKPVVLDEMSYEGNLPFGWGQHHRHRTGPVGTGRLPAVAAGVATGRRSSIPKT